MKPFRYERAHDSVTLYASNQGLHTVRDIIATAFGLSSERVRVITAYVGGAFGSRSSPHPNVILTVMAAQVAQRPVKFALTRQQLFALGSYRTPTIQRVQLGAERAGQLTAIAHDAMEQTAPIHEFDEPTSVAARVMYAAPNRRTTHRLARLDVPANSWMRAPGESPGMFALESAMDVLAIACRLDPIEIRLRNEPPVNPESGLPFSSRNLVACLWEGAQRLGCARRDPQPRARRDGDWLIGTGVAASTYPGIQFPASALVRGDQAGHYTIRIDAIDMGTRAWTVLTQIAADALEVPLERVQLKIGDSALPQASVGAGSTGTSSWGWACPRVSCSPGGRPGVWRWGTWLNPLNSSLRAVALPVRWRPGPG